MGISLHGMDDQTFFHMGLSRLDSVLSACLFFLPDSSHSFCSWARGLHFLSLSWSRFIRLFLSHWLVSFHSSPSCPAGSFLNKDVFIGVFLFSFLDLVTFCVLVSFISFWFSFFHFILSRSFYRMHRWLFLSLFIFSSGLFRFFLSWCLFSFRLYSFLFSLSWDFHDSFI